MNHGVPVGLVIDLAGALVLAALGVWLLLLKPRRRTTLLLAAFALTMGAGFVLLNAGDIVFGDPDTFGSVIAVLFHAASVALIWLALRLPHALRDDERRLVVLPAAAVGAMVLGIVALVLALPIVEPTFLLLLSWNVAEVMLVLAFGVALLLLPLRAARWVGDSAAKPRYRQAVLAAWALTIFPGLRYGMFGLQTGGGVLAFILAVPVVAAALWLRVAARGRVRGDASGDRGSKDPWTGTRAARNLALLSLAMPLFGMVLVALLGGAAFTSGISGVARTLTVLVLAWAILRHQLLDIDVTVRWSISKTTLAAIFVAVFFVVSEGAQELFATEAGLGPWLGILAAGALLFALAPLQRLTDRLADAAVPSARDPGAMDADERLAVYRDQVRAAWRDGTMTPDERRMLDALRDRLDLEPATAARVESEVAVEAGDKAA